MKKTLFTKFCRERRPEYQIMTRICEEDGVRSVEKCALLPEGKAHVNQMKAMEEVLRKLYAASDIGVAPCRDSADGVAVFPYLTSYSLEQAISEAADFATIKGLYEYLYLVLRNQDGLETFQPSEGFGQVFDHPVLPEGLWAVSCSNIDMIVSNILKDADGNWMLVDYEWVFPFQVPIEFIFARSIFLQERASSLPDEEQNELYAIAGITPGQIDTYYGMEVAFQEYVVGKRELYSLGGVYKALHRQVYSLGLLDPRQACFQIILNQTAPTAQEIGFESSVQTNCAIEFSLRDADPKGQLQLHLTGQEGVVKIRSLSGSHGDGIEFIPFTTNADVEIYDDYYFTQPPVLSFENNGYSSVTVSYQIYWSGNAVTPELVRLIRSEAELRDRYNIDVGRLTSENEALKRELEAMRQRKVVRIADKVQSVLKKEK